MVSCSPFHPVFLFELYLLEGLVTVLTFPNSTLYIHSTLTLYTEAVASHGCRKNCADADSETVMKCCN